MSIEASARAVLERCDILAAHSEEPDRLTRRYGTPPMTHVNDAVAGWMRAAGMTVRRDNIGNLIGRYEASETSAAGAGASGTFLLGSHLDTVRDAGRYDGPLGVLVALAAVERLHARGQRLPFALELLAFADEEGVRYHSGYLGSSAYAGRFRADTLAAVDDDGIPLAAAIRAFGGDPDALAGDARAPGDLLGYCEVHIEQGPMLEARDLPVGVVSSIQGQSRMTLGFTGEAGHAGTVPVSMRRDALGAASEFVLAVEAEARGTDGLVATVGQLAVEPGASNVIPGRAILSLDVRHPDDATRAAAGARLREHAQEIGRSRQVTLDWRELGQSRSVTCDTHLSALLARAATDSGYAALSLPSGAGHDGVMLSRLTGIAMLFVRCKGGVSHNPAESVRQEDVAVAIEVLGRFLSLVAAERGEL
ncbi:MAG TPA: allantoate amidohydrolase [Ktedonobacterales bacterium]|jgi:allantoate deiminase|nr:allantoate amidohydrolase [Ktedonobacterales bacterium]